MLLILCTAGPYLDYDDIKKTRGKSKMPKRHSVVFSSLVPILLQLKNPSMRALSCHGL